MSQRRAFRVCILGAGEVVKYVHLPAAIAHPRLELVGIATRTARGAVLAGDLRCPAYTDWRSALRECSPDIVVVAVPNGLHAMMAQEALERGCHVLVEKPAVVRVSDGWRLASAARERGLVVVVNMTLRFLRSFRAFISACQAEIDLPTARLSIRYHVSRPSAAWYFDPPASGGGILMNVAVHPIDVAAAVGGMPVLPLELASVSTDDSGVAAAIGVTGRGASGLEVNAEVSWEAEGLDAVFLVRDTRAEVELTLRADRWSLRCGEQIAQSGSVWQDMVENTALHEMVRALDGDRTCGASFEQHVSLLETLTCLTDRR